MKFGINLPIAFAETTTESLLSWAIQADQSGFSSITANDRLSYLNYEPLMTLGAMAAVTRRVELMTDVLIVPTREVHLLAKQAATLDQLSNGRLTLGIGVGNKIVDFQATQTPFNQRGKVLDQQLQQLKTIWSSEAVSGDERVVGPSPVQKGGPSLLFGGGAPATIQRICRWGDGCLLTLPPAPALSFYQQVEAGWKDAGRSGKPRFVAQLYVALGDDVSAQGANNVRDYYSFRGPAVADAIAQSVVTRPEVLKEFIRAYEDIGLDDLVIGPAIADVEQFSRIRDAVGL